jgi:hypothetical protein
MGVRQGSSFVCFKRKLMKKHNLLAILGVFFASLRNLTESGGEGVA